MYTGSSFNFYLKRRAQKNMLSYWWIGWMCENIFRTGWFLTIPIYKGGGGGPARQICTDIISKFSTCKVCCLITCEIQVCLFVCFLDLLNIIYWRFYKLSVKQLQKFLLFVRYWNIHAFLLTYFSPFMNCMCVCLESEDHPFQWWLGSFCACFFF